VLFSEPEFSYISTAMESTDETSVRMISEASISVQLPSPNLEPDELPNKIMEDFQKLDEHNEQ